jgi:hypothetical protein
LSCFNKEAWLQTDSEYEQVGNRAGFDVFFAETCALPLTCSNLEAASSARLRSRDPMINPVSPACTQRRASPKPSGPVPEDRWAGSCEFRLQRLLDDEFFWLL